MTENVLKVKNLKTYFHTFKGTVKAVDGISFELGKKEILGIVGESGCGKSVTGFSLIRLIEEPGKIVDGDVLFDDKNLIQLSESEMQALRGKKISMIFQDPMTSLNPIFTIEKQMEEVLILHSDLNKTERKNRCLELLGLVGIPNPKSRLKNYPYQLSGGMRQRVIIAIALATRPKLIIADEPTTALDVTIQAQILRLLKKLVKEENCSLILISHDLAVISNMTDRINVMYCGKIVESGKTNEVVHQSLHPYTDGLLKSIPRFSSETEKLDTIRGIVPNMFDLPTGCRFFPRCKFGQEVCQKEEPHLKEIATDRHVACHFPLNGECYE